MFYMNKVKLKSLLDFLKRILLGIETKKYFRSFEEIYW